MGFVCRWFSQYDHRQDALDSDIDKIVHHIRCIEIFFLPEFFE